MVTWSVNTDLRGSDMRHPSFIIAVAMACVVAAPPLAAQPSPMPPPEEPGAHIDELEAARHALAEAARRVAELSAGEADRLIRRFDIERVTVPPVRLGIVVAADAEHRDGVTVGSVDDGGPAASAGLMAGDLLLEIDGVSLAAGGDGARPPVQRIHAALAEAKPGDSVAVKYRRGRRTHDASVTLEASPHAPLAFRFRHGDGAHRTIEVPMPPDLGALARLRPFGHYELVRVSPALGAYFNTDRGLLVVRAGDHNPLTLRDGDVILAIDGREPESPMHAARILRTYRPGERISLEIMRERRQQTVEATIPER